jgi:hypothetical protein
MRRCAGEMLFPLMGYAAAIVAGAIALRLILRPLARSVPAGGQHVVVGSWVVGG